MEEERKRILEMLQKGKVTLEEAESLLDALQASHQGEQRPEAESAQPAGTDLAGLSERMQALDEEDDRRIRSNLGELMLTQEYLSRMADDSTFKNLGKLTIGPDVTEELLARKIAKYDNLGITYGPFNLLSVLQGRCGSNLGKFVQIYPGERP